MPPVDRLCSAGAHANAPSPGAVERWFQRTSHDATASAACTPDDSTVGGSRGYHAQSHDFVACQLPVAVLLLVNEMENVPATRDDVWSVKRAVSCIELTSEWPARLLAMIVMPPPLPANRHANLAVVSSSLNTPTS